MRPVPKALTFGPCSRCAEQRADPQAVSRGGCEEADPVLEQPHTAPKRQMESDEIIPRGESQSQQNNLGGGRM
ncbi:Hypothetical predicted protein [Pelobates cultripes]|uniref:Uncharacterized protein n=1 Tax=Pelobates cultripes TaxID=61616 RepID=A0AAD1QWG6_PELCU|nr:Hypothetical predicted protein [Pelobates cultripes]